MLFSVNDGLFLGQNRLYYTHSISAHKLVPLLHNKIGHDLGIELSASQPNIFAKSPKEPCRFESAWHGTDDLAILHAWEAIEKACPKAPRISSILRSSLLILFSVKMMTMQFSALILQYYIQRY